MTKLKPGTEVIYVETNLVDKTKVISIDKEKGIAKLDNGIILNREILKKGYFKRYGKRSDARAYIYEENSEGYRIYQAYLDKVNLLNLIPSIKKSVSEKNILSDYGWLREFRSLIEKYL